ncbi:MAG: hypothetical protein ACRDGV_10205 [Candidatus Limnocylindria bacterium]
MAEAGLNGTRAVWVVEDDPAAAALAAELCAVGDAEATLFASALPFLAALQDGLAPPAAVVLDWRLERELSAGAFLAIRHRFADVPVIYWTGIPLRELPAMIRDDPRTLGVDKAHGAEAFERALAWALATGGVKPKP